MTSVIDHRPRRLGAGAAALEQSLSMFTTRPQLQGTYGMVASTHWLASSTGMAVLEDGGNAYDAAVAAGFVLHVVEPHLNGVGGDMPLIGHDGGSGTTFVICGQGTAPQAATAQAYRDAGADLVPGTGLLAATVPGTFGAWMQLLSRYGTKTIREVLSYAIGYARHGHPVLAGAVRAIEGMAGVFAEHWPASALIYLPGGKPPRAGELLRNEPLAATLERIVSEAEAASSERAEQIEAARRAFYSGFVAEQIDAFARTEQWDGTPRTDGSTAPRAGLLTGADLDSWSAAEEDPVWGEFGGAQIAKTGPWGQGPVLLQQLAMLRALDVGSAEPGSADLVHTVVEVAKLAFADREAYYGDPDFVDVPLTELLSVDYARDRAAMVGDQASTEFRPGDTGGGVPEVAEFARAAMTGVSGGRAAAGAGEPTMASSAVEREDSGRGDTCHLDVVDRWGNAVSATPSGGWLQSSPVIPGLGFALGTRAQMFWIEQGLASSLAPRRRPRTTLSPGMLVRDGRPMPFGTPGGDQQDQWVVPFLISHLLHGLNVQAAIDAVSWHTTQLPSSFYPREAEVAGLHAESRLGGQVLAQLRRRGHRVTDTGPWSLGRLSAAGIGADGLLYAAANARGMQGYAVGR